MRVPVKGRSMEPALSDAEVVDVDLDPDRPPRVGEVVLAIQGRALVLHRLIAIGPAGAVTQGDAAPVPDDPVAVERVIGIALVPARPLQARMRSVIAFTRAQIRRHRLKSGERVRRKALSRPGNLS